MFVGPFAVAYVQMGEEKLPGKLESGQSITTLEYGDASKVSQSQV
jgi:hypothetical protein